MMRAVQVVVVLIAFMVGVLIAQFTVRQYADESEAVATLRQELAQHITDHGVVETRQDEQLMEIASRLDEQLGKK